MTLTETPAAVSSRNASTPSAVAGTLISTFSRSISALMRLPASIEPAVSCASSGGSSNEMCPS